MLKKTSKKALLTVVLRYFCLKCFVLFYSDWKFGEIFIRCIKCRKEEYPLWWLNKHDWMGRANGFFFVSERNRFESMKNINLVKLYLFFIKLCNRSVPTYYGKFLNKMISYCPINKNVKSRYYLIELVLDCRMWKANKQGFTSHTQVGRQIKGN